MRIITAIWMTAVIVVAFLFSPPLRGLGEAGRIFYFHVPCAWVGSLAYICSAYCAVRYLRTRKLEWDAESVTAAQIGLLFTILATLSGMVWAEAAWGKYWNWDPRQVAIFIVMLIYGAYFAIRSSISQPDQRAASSAAYSLLAAIAAFFLIYVAPRLPGLDSLHPSPMIPSPNDESGIEGRILAVFLASMAGFTMLYFWMWRVQARLEKLALRVQARRTEQPVAAVVRRVGDTHPTQGKEAT